MLRSAGGRAALPQALAAGGRRFCGGVSGVMARVRARDGAQTEYMQAFSEVAASLAPVFAAPGGAALLPLLERLAEPERAVVFRVPWVDDGGVWRTNRGFRVQHSSALGPYKGGLRFHPTVNLSVMKFLAFEQTLKNALTGLALGGAKGGSDFDPRNKSEREVHAFCQSFATELWRHVGPLTDVPAGDIGVGAREIGFLFGQVKRIAGGFPAGSFTGKPVEAGGSLLRPEATGYGVVYFAREWARRQKAPTTLAGARALVSGAGNVALHAAEKLIHERAVPLTLSDSGGTVLEADGFDAAKLAEMKRIKGGGGRVRDYAERSETAKYFPGQQPYTLTELPHPIPLIFPCATQNEINRDDALRIASLGARVVVEGANMPSTDEACQVYREKKIDLCPAKAANAGGVAVSGFEMAQNASRAVWSADEVDAKLQRMMSDIYTRCVDAAAAYSLPSTDLQTGANIAGFLRVASAMKEQGCV